MPKGVAHGREVGPAAEGMGAMRVAHEVWRDWDLGDPGEPSGALDPLPRVNRAHGENEVLRAPWTS
jgi:hypothetical protein